MTRQKAIWVLTGGLALMVMALLAATSLIMFREAQQANAAANAARIDAESARRRAEVVTGFLTETLSKVDPARLPGDVRVRYVLDNASLNVEGSLSDSPHVEAQVRLVLGQGYLELGEYDRAAPELLRAYALRRAEFGESHEQTRQVIEQLVKLYEAMDRPDDAAKWRARLGE